MRLPSLFGSQVQEACNDLHVSSDRAVEDDQAHAKPDPCGGSYVLLAVCKKRWRRGIISLGIFFKHTLLVALTFPRRGYLRS